jgi:hypothetical protein
MLFKKASDWPITLAERIICKNINLIFIDRGSINYPQGQFDQVFTRYSQRKVVLMMVVL